MVSYLWCGWIEGHIEDSVCVLLKSVKVTAASEVIDVSLQRVRQFISSAAGFATIFFYLTCWENFMDYFSVPLSILNIWYLYWYLSKISRHTDHASKSFYGWMLFLWFQNVSLQPQLRAVIRWKRDSLKGREKERMREEGKERVWVLGEEKREKRQEPSATSADKNRCWDVCYQTATGRVPADVSY